MSTIINKTETLAPMKRCRLTNKSNKQLPRLTGKTLESSVCNKLTTCWIFKWLLPMSILLLVNIIFVSYMIGSRRQAKATLGDSNEPSLVSEKGLDVDLLANDVRSSYVLFSEGDTFLYAFQKRPTVDASRERVGHTLVDRKNESTTKVLYDFSVAKGWGISRWLDSVEECETIILSGDTVNSTHVEIAGKIKDLNIWF